MKATVVVSRKTGERVRKGFLWIFKGEIRDSISSFSPGEIIPVHEENGKFLAKGYINPSRTLAVRLLTTKNEAITPEFFEKKIKEAVQLREAIGFTAEHPRRLVHSEGDALPGLIVDQYGEILVVQFLTAGMEKWKTLLLELLGKTLSPSVLFEKSAGEFRKQEGLQDELKVHTGTLPENFFFEMDGLKFYVDFLEGHKTGFYLDQRENRQALKSHVREKIVLDAFAHTGAMSLYAVRFGAKEVEAVEDSRKTIPLLERNIRENRCESYVKPVCANAFHYLREKAREKKEYDCIILDPPSFAKSKRELKDALRGYKELHLSAFKLLKSGGFLITYSCSQNVSEEAFLDAILEAAGDTGASLQIIEKQGASKDHPVRAGMPETDYLKGFVIRKL